MWVNPEYRQRCAVYGWSVDERNATFMVASQVGGMHGHGGACGVYVCSVYTTPVGPSLIAHSEEECVEYSYTCAS